MNKNLIQVKMIVSHRFMKAYGISMSELKHEVFDRTVLYS